MRINETKTHYILYTQKNKPISTIELKIGQQKIEEVEYSKYLGLVLDNKLNWEDHIEALKRKCSPMLGAIFRCRQYLNTASKYSIHNSYFLSRLRYLITAWGNCSKTKFEKAERLQNKIIKIIFNFDFLTPTMNIYRDTQILPLSKLMIYEQCKMVYKLKSGLQKFNTKITYAREHHEYNTRNQDNFYQYNTRTDKGINENIRKSFKAYDSLPREIKSIPNISKFLRELKNFLSV